MKELLGFMVLTGPLWVILVLLTVAKCVQGPSKKTGIKILVFLTLLLFLLGDEMVGRIYLNYLCATEAGVKIYETVELPSEYWDERGEPTFFDKHGYLQRDFWLKQLDESGARVACYSFFCLFDKEVLPVKERTSRKVLAEVTTFRYWGGWIRKNFSPHNSANSCEFIGDPRFSRRLYSQVFRPATSSQ